MKRTARMSSVPGRSGGRGGCDGGFDGGGCDGDARRGGAGGEAGGVGGADGAASDGEVIENCAAGAASGVAGSSSSSSLESASQSITFCFEALSMASRGCSKKAAWGLLAVLAIAKLSRDGCMARCSYDRAQTP